MIIEEIKVIIVITIKYIYHAVHRDMRGLECTRGHRN